MQIPNEAVFTQSRFHMLVGALSPGTATVQCVLVVCCSLFITLFIIVTICGLW